MSLNANWTYPTHIRVGAGRFRELADVCRILGIKSPMLVTDRVIAELPILDRAA